MVWMRHVIGVMMTWPQVEILILTNWLLNHVFLHLKYVTVQRMICAGGWK